MAGALQDAAVVGLDGFYRPLAAEERAALGPKESYDRYLDWERLLRDVLVPLSRHSRARYRRYDWVTNALAEWHEIEPRGVVIVEGVYSTRPELRPYFSVMVYVDAPRKVRLATPARSGVRRHILGRSLDCRGGLVRGARASYQAGGTGRRRFVSHAREALPLR